MGVIKKALKTVGNVATKAAALPIQTVVAPKAAARTIEGGLKNAGTAVQEAWVPLRDAAETGGALYLNYLYPGSSLVTSRLVSDRARKNLNSPLGALAQIGTGLTGAGVGQGFTGIPSAADQGYGWSNLIGNMGLGAQSAAPVTELTPGLEAGADTFVSPYADPTAGLSVEALPPDLASPGYGSLDLANVSVPHPMRGASQNTLADLSTALPGGGPAQELSTADALENWLASHKNTLALGAGALALGTSAMSAKKNADIQEQLLADQRAEQARVNAAIDRQNTAWDPTAAREFMGLPSQYGDVGFGRTSTLHRAANLFRNNAANLADGGPVKMAFGGALRRAVAGMAPSLNAARSASGSMTGAALRLPISGSQFTAMAQAPAMQVMQAAPGGGALNSRVLSLLRNRLSRRPFAGGGHLGGASGGQADDVPAMLSDGEYVFDADTVAALGDGNNAAGAAKLDKMRESIRKHKRSAPATKIPPKAKAPEQYLAKRRK